MIYNKSTLSANLVLRVVRVSRDLHVSRDQHIKDKPATLLEMRSRFYSLYLCVQLNIDS